MARETWERPADCPNQNLIVKPTFTVAEAEPHEVVDGRAPVRKHLAGLQFARCEDVLLHALNC